MLACLWLAFAILSLVALVATGPPGVHVGWRVSFHSYAAPGTDRHPPFRLDRGGGESPATDSSPGPAPRTSAPVLGDG